MGWVGLVGFGLLVALLSVALVQARQFSLLRETMRSGDDAATLRAYQAEIEYLRVREAWRHALDVPALQDVQTLKQRYAQFVASLRRLQGERTSPLADDPGLLDALTALERFMLRAGPELADQGTGPGADFLFDAWPELDALGAAVHRLSLSAAQQTADRVEQRHLALQQHNQLGLGLTLFLSVLTLAFAYIALRQVRQLKARRLALEQLATSLGTARREAESAIQAKTAFLSSISHQLRTPLHGLMGSLSLLRETGLTARQVDCLRAATESADQLLASLNDLLDMSELESGRLTLARVPVNLRNLLREVEALMRPLASAKALALHMDAEPAVPEWVLADPTRLKQILSKLLSNAIKFSDRGTVVVDLRLRHGEAGRQELECSVADTGMGMNQATQDELFTRFTHGDNSHSRRPPGAGLGLEICRHLARLMNGDITANSRVGEGSCFTLRLPLTTDPGLPPEQAGPGGARATQARALRVLVAEDHPVNRQYMAALLDSMGHQAQFVSDGQAAVTAARESVFDLVLMDLHMPVMDGVAATRAIRALPLAAQSTVPIVAMTADSLQETRDRCLVAGMNDFLTKPVSPQKFASQLRQLFGTQDGETAKPQAELPQALRAHATVDAAALLNPTVIDAALQAMSRPRLASMIHAFLDQGPQTVQHLRTAVRDAQALDLRVSAHAAKGAALNLGLSALAQTASTLHEGATHLPAHEIARLVQRYEDLLPATRQAAQDAGLFSPDAGR